MRTLSIVGLAATVAEARAKAAARPTIESVRMVSPFRFGRTGFKTIASLAALGLVWLDVSRFGNRPNPGLTRPI